MENGVITSGGLARVMQSVNDGVLEVTDVTVGLAEAFSALSDSETAYAN
jgi:predicted Rossmann-fold nucleotide-binding protein